MESFKFNGDWEYELNLREFQKSNSKWNKNPNSKISERPIKLKILDLKNFDPDPLPEQFESIYYIINHEKLVLDSLCRVFKTINKQYGDRSGDHDWYSNKMKLNDLGSIFLIKKIEIFTEHKNGKAYFQLSGEYRGDEEHGLIVVMHGDKLIGFDQIGEDCYKEVYENLGELGKKNIDFNIKHQTFGEGIIHKPLMKYGKFKPWQELAMTEYFESLFRTKNNEKIKDIVLNEKFDINHPIEDNEKSLTDLAAYFGNSEILEFLIKEGGDFSKSILRCNYKNTIEILVKNGISIDYMTGYGGTRLFDSIRSYASALKRKADKAIEI
ncbi:MAG: hypothetical protein AAFZ15_34125, partial [Bacteroidota bacterium]